MTKTAKEIVKDLFLRRPVDRLPVVPWVFRHAAKLEQVSVQGMFSSSHVLSKTLNNAQKLYGYDVIINNFDPTLEAEACGCNISWENVEEFPRLIGCLGADKVEAINVQEVESRGRLPVVISATQALRITAGKSVAIAGVVTGPLTLAGYLTGRDILHDLETNPEVIERAVDQSAKVSLKVAKLYCELRVDLVVVADEQLGRVKSHIVPRLTRYLRPIWNVAHYYEAYTVLLTKGNGSAEQFANIVALGADAVAAGLVTPLKDGPASRRGACLGVPVPLSTLLGQTNCIEEAVAKLLYQASLDRLFLTTEWEVPFDTPVENMHHFMHCARKQPRTI